MIETLDNSKNYFNSYIQDNRVKIDEALVSLRLMKEVDEFLDYSNINQRDFAKTLGYSEAFVSQLMSGTKKINTSFINRFEKVFDLKIDFQIKRNDEYDFISKFSDSSIEVNIKIIDLIESDNVYTFENNHCEFSEFNSDVFKLEYNE